MKKKIPHIAIVNGPNLKSLGKREPHIYGTTPWADVEKALQAAAKVLKVRITVAHEHREGELTHLLHTLDKSADAIVFNPGAFSHHSVAIRDAVAALSIPVVEVHVSNLARREAFRSHSYISGVASGMIMGFGLMGYELGLWAAHKKIKEPRHA